MRYLFSTVCSAPPGKPHSSFLDRQNDIILFIKGWRKSSFKKNPELWKKTHFHSNPLEELQQLKKQAFRKSIIMLHWTALLLKLLPPGFQFATSRRNLVSTHLWSQQPVWPSWILINKQRPFSPHSHVQLQPPQLDLTVALTILTEHRKSNVPKSYDWQPRRSRPHKPVSRGTGPKGWRGSKVAAPCPMDSQLAPWYVAGALLH